MDMQGEWMCWLISGVAVDILSEFLAALVSKTMFAARARVPQRTLLQEVFLACSWRRQGLANSRHELSATVRLYMRTAHIARTCLLRGRPLPRMAHGSDRCPRTAKIVIQDSREPR